MLCPSCVYRCGCAEMKTCGWWDRMLQKTGGLLASTHIDERYETYNRLFWEARRGGADGQN